MARLTREEFDAKLREEIARGEITPEDAESEWDFFVNGPDSREKLFGI